MKIMIHQLREHDLAEADRIFRLAFGNFFGLPDPMSFAGDADYVRTRYYADPSSAYGATIVDNKGGGTSNGNDDQKLVGSNFTANWGSVGSEKLIIESAIPYTFLRPNEFMQGFINFQGTTIKSNNAFYVPAEDAKVSFVDTRDIAAMAVKALVEGDKHYNKAYMVTGPEALSYHQAADKLSNATGRKIDYVNISEEETRDALKETGMDDWLINSILGLYMLYRNDHASEVSSAVEEVTGRKATTFVVATDHADAFR